VNRPIITASQWTSLVRLLAIVGIVLATGIASQPALAATGPLCYVDMGATGGTNNGNSWANAYLSLQSALHDANCIEIWVAEGLYKPGTLMSSTFQVPPGVAVYGGFAGTESTRSQRDWTIHLTVLSGDVDNNDTTDPNGIVTSTAGITGNNSTHVVSMFGSTAAPITSATTMDGFVITAGHAVGQNGGGLDCRSSGAGAQCNSLLANLKFIGNFAESRGGALYVHGNDTGEGSPTLMNVLFQANSTDHDGGAMFTDGEGSSAASGASNPQLYNVVFDSNAASDSGGALYVNARWGAVSNPQLANVTFTGNQAGYDGGAIYINGFHGTSSPTLANVTFAGNEADNNGGAIYVDAQDGTSASTLTNVILWGNTAIYGPQLDYGSTATVSLNYSIVDGGEDGISGYPNAFSSGTGNLSGDPKLGPLADNGGFTPTMSLIAWASSAIDTGDDTTCATAPVSGLDQRGITRPQGLHCDIGALERVPPGARADFESDGISDIGYFRAASGLWALLESSEDFSFAAPRYYSWGQTGDILALGDYDGDGRMDPTVRRPPAGGQSAAYRMLLSTTGYNFASSLTVPAGWPGLGDTPVPGDYNGDGISDPAIWRGSAGVWIIPLSPAFNTYQFFSWNITGDTPVGADVDGDGQTDIGYWRPSTGVWGFLLSTEDYSYASPLFFNWGQTGDIPVMADYDGDLLADPAVVIPPAGGQSRAYRILLSTMSYSPASSMTIPAGWPGLGDTPVPGDYDGDGKADAGIWRANAGVWIIPKSSTNNSVYMFASWGALGDQVAR